MDLEVLSLTKLSKFLDVRFFSLVFKFVIWVLLFYELSKVVGYLIGVVFGVKII